MKREEVIENIKLLEMRKIAVQSMRERMAELDEDAYSVSARPVTVAPMRGGGNHTEDKYIRMIDAKSEKEKEILELERKIRTTERALYRIDKRERMALLWVYQKRRATLWEICEKLHCSRSELYRLKEKGLKKMEVMMG